MRYQTQNTSNYIIITHRKQHPHRKQPKVRYMRCTCMTYPRPGEGVTGPRGDDGAQVGGGGVTVCCITNV